MIFIVNKYKHTPTNLDVYIGRGSILGNPFTSIKDKKTKAEFVCDSRKESISQFQEYITKEISLKNLEICAELNRIWLMAKEGHVYLVCFCKPKDCHGDIIKQLIESKMNKVTYPNLWDEDTTHNYDKVAVVKWLQKEFTLGLRDAKILAESSEVNFYDTIRANIFCDFLIETIGVREVTLFEKGITKNIT